MIRRDQHPDAAVYTHAIRTLAFLFPDADIPTLVEDLDGVQEAWSPQRPKSREIIARKLFHTISQTLHRDTRMRLLAPIRRFRTPHSTYADVSTPPCLSFNEIVGILISVGHRPRPYANNKKWAFVFSFDIDQKICADQLEACSRYLCDRGISASFNLLTGGEYKFHHRMVELLNVNGHEVGLHGHRHDIAIGYRSKANMRAQISRALELLNSQPKGYRAPALAASKELIHELIDFGFEYDTSLPAFNSNLPAVGTTFPYPLDQASHFYELPVALQDSTLFLDFRFDKEMALAYVEQFIHQCSAQHAPFVFNLHPYVFAAQPGFFEDLVSLVLSFDDVWICRQDQLVEFFRET